MEMLSKMLGFMLGRMGVVNWYFRARFVTEYNAWVLETKEKEDTGWVIAGARRQDADHEIMAVKFSTRAEVMAHVRKTGMIYAYKEQSTLERGFFKIQWQYRIRLNPSANDWVLETWEKDNVGWSLLGEYVNLRSAHEYVRVPLSFSSYQAAKLYAQTLGLDESYKELRSSSIALPSVLNSPEELSHTPASTSMANTIAMGASVRALPNRHFLPPHH